MQTRVERVGGGFALVLTQEDMEELSLSEGTIVDIRKSGDEYEMSAAKHRYMSVDEGIRAYKETEPRYAVVYQKLAE